MTMPRAIPLVDLDAAVALLRAGGVAALPTDTLYALAANARDADAVGRVFDIKGRQAGKPLPLFVTDIVMAERIAFLDSAAARRLAHRFWPGVLTLVLRRRPEFQSAALTGGETVALRVPDHHLARETVRLLGEPITATSANRSGGRDPDTAAEVRRQLGDAVDLIVDGGVCPVGVSSTIVDCTGDTARIRRQGAMPAAVISEALGDTGGLAN